MSAAGKPGMLERPARVLVGGVRVVRRYRTPTSLLGLVLILLIGGGYLMLDTLGKNPLVGQFRVRVELTESGGLLAGQDVTVRGVQVGRVESVRVAGDKVVAVAAIDAPTKISQTADVRVAALSAAGEQYLDFLPSSEAGPFLADGAVIASDRTTSPVPLSKMLEKLSGTLEQVHPDQVRAITRELGVSPEGPEKLAAILDGGIFMLSTLHSVLPETVGLLRNSTVLLGTLADSEEALRNTATNLSGTLGGVASMSGGFAELVNRAPDAVATMDAVVAQNSPTMVQLLGNLTTVGRMVEHRAPAFEEFFFPQQRDGSALDAISTAIHDDAVWALASIYPRYQCDYDVPRRPGTIPNFPEPYLNVDCRNPDPMMLPRGARNAPRPPGVEALPPNAEPLETADPTPPGPFMIPTPYGGAHTPSHIPPR